MYLKHLYTSILIIVLYFYDLFITWSFIVDIGSVKSSLHNSFPITGLGLLKQYLGLEIEQSNTCIMVIQLKYVSDLLENFKMHECKFYKFLLLSRVKLGDFSSSPLVDNSLYRKLVGILLYLTHSQTDLSYAVGAIVMYMKEPHDIHWKDAKRILHYVHKPKTSGYTMLLVLH